MRGLFIFSFCGFAFYCNAQLIEPEYHIIKSSAIIRIDGNLNESAWSNAEKKGDFIQHFPYDTSKAATKTEYMFSYDDENIYCGVICYNKNPEKDFVLQTLKRDFSITNSDAVVLTLSPFIDGQNGFSFGVTPKNSQREGAIEGGGNFGVTTAWDQIWYSATYSSKDTWFAEFQIPFKSIRFSEGNKLWHFNLARADFKNNEISTWIKVPRNFNISSLSFSGHLIWPEAPVRKGKNIAIIPYISNLSTGDGPFSLTKSGGEMFNKSKIRIGGDAKIGLSSSLNLDLTINPDFAQVEVDEQQINLTRFSLFFPERRQFFIENSDLFANFGFRQIRPFFSRRIGLGSTGNIPIDAGARITGKINNKWRIGAIVAQTRVNESFEAGAKNYMVAAFQRKVFAASNIGFILVNDMDGAKNSFGKKYNTVTGVEYNLQSKNNRWIGKAFAQKSFHEGSAKETWSHATFLVYRNIYWDAMWNHEYVGKNFKANTGFVPRTENPDPLAHKTYYLTYWRLEPSITRTFYPKKSRINNYNFTLYNSSYYDSTFKPTETYTSFTTNITSQKAASLRLGFSHNYFDLYVPFSPIKNPKIFLFGKYEWYAGTVGFTSNNRKKLNGLIDIAFGNYYNGTRYAISGSVQYRRQPWGVLAVTYRREQIDLNSLGNTVLNLIGAKLDISFSTVKYFTAFLQYNTQTDNVNINLRFQWRFRPLSDFFVVYSENYNPEFQSKNRSLALKLVYWFNT